mmetsp:Transcript_1297/g.3162  ORF Transcript_1297/g.3162 Transcript_1297/m.3162 type:complete len:203 (-) Transcript_1297:1252-1860(-)
MSSLFVSARICGGHRLIQRFDALHKHLSGRCPDQSCILIVIVFYGRRPHLLHALVVENSLEYTEGSVQIKDVHQGLDAERLRGGAARYKLAHAYYAALVRSGTVSLEYAVIHKVHKLRDLYLVKVCVVLEDHVESLQQAIEADSASLISNVGKGRAVGDHAEGKARYGLADAHLLMDDAVVDLGQLTKEGAYEEVEDKDGNL